MPHRTIIVAVSVLLALVGVGLSAPLDATLYSAMKWRCIGPFRGGRTVGATGIPGRPNEFLIGVNNGGVWKTTDYGHTWKPIFDDQPTGSIGALAVAPSNAQVIYVATGEGLQRPDLSVGNGVYRSADGGKTWNHVGLRDAQQIGAVIVDPRNPDRVFMAALGHPYGPNPERGVFRTSNGGTTWEKVLFKDENTGAIALAFDPSNSEIIYAVLWAARQGPWENGAWQGPGNGLFKSTDGGTTWAPLTKGLPKVEQGLGRIGVAVAPSEPKRLFAIVDCPRIGGLYRSDDAGESWRLVNGDARLWSRGSDFAEVKVDPKNPDRVYVANIAFYRSDDGGRSFACTRGAPGGDDYHTIWIHPDDPRILLLATDQGATITVNGGDTWSSWYNQPTAQFYHVSTDNRFPYWVYGGQQESGSAAVASRGKDGQITFRDWHPVGVEEYGYVAPDPLNADIVYGGKITRFDRRTGQVQDISPEAARSGRYRFLRTAPVLFAPTDPRCLYFAGNVLFKTTTGGQSWEVISPDLSRQTAEAPASSVFRGMEVRRRGVIYTVAPSYRDSSVIWAGTDDGLIHVTRDAGKSWTDVTPPDLTPWSKVSLIDAGRHAPGTAYAAINRIRLDDQKPHIYRTHDYGKTWKQVVNGLPDDPVNAVREDPFRRGLLFAGTERMVHVSFNDGDDWQPLRLNMPCTSIRDLVIKDDDLVVGTHGRGFWILDNLSPLRQASKSIADSDAYLFRPPVAYRVRWNMNTDTPLPPEEPAGKNPPEGAIIDYYLKKDADGPVVLEITDETGAVVRRFSSDDKPAPLDPRTMMMAPEWQRPFQPLPHGHGAHRFAWDLRYAALDSPRALPIAAIHRDTVPEPRGPWVKPGRYTVWLTANGFAHTQSLDIRLDPRVTTPTADLDRQHRLSMTCYEGARKARAIVADVRALREQVRERQTRATTDALKETLTTYERQLFALEGQQARGRRGGPPDENREASLGRVAGELASLLRLLQESESAPTRQAERAVLESSASAAAVFDKWRFLSERELAAVNAKLSAAKVQPLAVSAAPHGGK